MLNTCPAHLVLADCITLRHNKLHIIQLLMQILHLPLISQQPVLRHSRLILRDQVLHLMVSLLILDHSKSEMRQTNVYQVAQISLWVSLKNAQNLLSFGIGLSATCQTGHFVSRENSFISANKMAEGEMQYITYI